MLPDVVSQTHSTHRIFIEYCIVFKLNSIRGSISVPTQALTIYRERVLARYEHTSRSLFSHTIRIFAYKSYVNKPLPLSRSHSVFGRLLYTCQHCWAGWLCWCFFFSQFSDESAPVYTLKIHNSSELQLGPTLNYANIFGIYAVASYCCCGIFYMLYYSDSFGSLVLSMLVVGDFHAPHERILYGMETEKFRKIKWKWESDLSSKSSASEQS